MPQITASAPAEAAEAIARQSSQGTQAPCGGLGGYCRGRTANPKGWDGARGTLEDRRKEGWVGPTHNCISLQIPSILDPAGTYFRARRVECLKGLNQGPCDAAKRRPSC